MDRIQNLPGYPPFSPAYKLLCKATWSASITLLVCRGCPRHPGPPADGYRGMSSGGRWRLSEIGRVVQPTYIPAGGASSPSISGKPPEAPSSVPVCCMPGFPVQKKVGQPLRRLRWNYTLTPVELRSSCMSRPAAAQTHPRSRIFRLSTI